MTVINSDWAQFELPKQREDRLRHVLEGAIGISQGNDVESRHLAQETGNGFTVAGNTCLPLSFVWWPIGVISKGHVRDFEPFRGQGGKERVEPVRLPAETHEGVGGEIGGDGNMDVRWKTCEGDCLGHTLCLEEKGMVVPGL